MTTQENEMRTMTPDIDEDSVTLDRSLSDMKWGLRLIALVLVAGAVSMGIAWADQFYRGESVNAILSWSAVDTPWMPSPASPVAIIGNHDFGDFQLPYAWALNMRHSLSPFLNSALPANYPPFALAFLIPFTFISIKLATLLFLSLSATIFLLPLWLLLSPMKFSLRCVILVPTALVSIGMITMLDRGNEIGIGFGLVSWAVWAWRSERWYWCATFLAVAIGFKAYPLLLLIVPLALRKYRFTFAVILMAIFSNLIVLAFFPGGFIQNLRVMVSSMTATQITTGSEITSWSLYSLLPKVAGLLLGPSHAASLLHPNQYVLWVPSAVYLAVVFVIIRRNSLPQWCWGTLSLASLQLAVPIGGGYATGWVSLASIWYLQGSFTRDQTAPGKEFRSDDSLLRILVMLALAVTIVPSVVTIGGTGGFNVLATKFLSPAFLLITLCVAFSKSTTIRYRVFHRKQSTLFN